MKNIRRLLSGALVMFPLACDSGRNLTLLEKYPGPWRNDVNVKIIRTLEKNKIRDCGQYKYRPSAGDPGEYLVRCTSDGVNWNSYLVWVGINRVRGPYLPDSSLDKASG